MSASREVLLNFLCAFGGTFLSIAEELQQLLASSNPEILRALQAGLQRMVGASSGYLESLPAPVRTRISYLNELQDEYDDMEKKFNEEVRALEEKYKKLYSK